MHPCQAFRFKLAQVIPSAQHLDKICKLISVYLSASISISATKKGVHRAGGHADAQRLQEPRHLCLGKRAAEVLISLVELRLQVQLVDLRAVARVRHVSHNLFESSVPYPELLVGVGDYVQSLHLIAVNDGERAGRSALKVVLHGFESRG